jgi:hypothetical protein
VRRCLIWIGICAAMLLFGFVTGDLVTIIAANE